MHLPPRPRWTQIGYALFWLALLAGLAVCVFVSIRQLGTPNNIYARAMWWFAIMSLSTLGLALGFSLFQWILRRCGICLGSFMRQAEEDHRQWLQEWRTEVRARREAQVLENHTTPAQGRTARPRL